ncbi:MAG: hypothetical protein ACRDG9_13055 [Actinomycetota bacterium]
MGVDWGEPGSLAGNAADLDPSFPEATRRRMVEYHGPHERYQYELLGYLH